MSKTFKLIIVLIFTTYHFSFVFSNYYSEPKIIYRQRKSGSWPRSVNINWPRKAFEIRDRKAFEISDIYTEDFLDDVESRLPPKPSISQQWQAAVETRPRKKDKFPEMVQKSRQEKNVDMVRPEEQPQNILKEPTEKIKNSQKKIQQLKEEIRKEQQNKKGRQKKEETLSIEMPKTPVQNMPKELQSEEDHYMQSSQTAVVDENNLRGGSQRHLALISRQGNHNHHCSKKCYTPKCEVECIGRQGSAACSANKCKASTRGPDSAAVCKGENCQGLCFKAECIAACEGEGCVVKCEGTICHAVAEGRKAASECEGDYCVAYGKGPATKPKCEGKLCQTWCVGERCIAKCKGYKCEAMCSGKHCKAQCKGKNCTQFHYPGTPPKPDKAWIVDELDPKSEEISISDESSSDDEKYLEIKDNAKVDDDGYYGNKNHVKNTINDLGSSVVENDNNGHIDNSGNVPFSPVQVPVRNTGTGDVTLDYSIDVQISKGIGEYLRNKLAGLKDVSLLRYLPSLI